MHYTERDPLDLIGIKERETGVLMRKLRRNNPPGSTKIKTHSDATRLAAAGVTENANGKNTKKEQEVRRYKIPQGSDARNLAFPEADKAQKTYIFGEGADQFAIIVKNGKLGYLTQKSEGIQEITERNTSFNIVIREGLTITLKIGKELSQIIQLKSSLNFNQDSAPDTPVVIDGSVEPEEAPKFNEHPASLASLAQPPAITLPDPNEEASTEIETILVAPNETVALDFSAPKHVWLALPNDFRIALLRPERANERTVEIRSFRFEGVWQEPAEMFVEIGCDSELLLLSNGDLAEGTISGSKDNTPIASIKVLPNGMIRLKALETRANNEKLPTSPIAPPTTVDYSDSMLNSGGVETTDEHDVSITSRLIDAIDAAKSYTVANDKECIVLQVNGVNVFLYVSKTADNDYLIKQHDSEQNFVEEFRIIAGEINSEYINIVGPATGNDIAVELICGTQPDNGKLIACFFDTNNQGLKLSTETYEQYEEAGNQDEPSPIDQEPAAVPTPSVPVAPATPPQPAPTPPAHPRMPEEIIEIPAIGFDRQQALATALEHTGTASYARNRLVGLIGNIGAGLKTEQEMQNIAAPIESHLKNKLGIIYSEIIEILFHARIPCIITLQKIKDSLNFLPKKRDEKNVDEEKTYSFRYRLVLGVIGNILGLKLDPNNPMGFKVLNKIYNILHKDDETFMETKRCIDQIDGLNFGEEYGKLGEKVKSLSNRIDKLLELGNFNFHNGAKPNIDDLVRYATDVETSRPVTLEDIADRFNGKLGLKKIPRGLFSGLLYDQSFKLQEADVLSLYRLLTEYRELQSKIEVKAFELKDREEQLIAEGAIREFSLNKFEENAYELPTRIHLEEESVKKSLLAACAKAKRLPETLEDYVNTISAKGYAFSDYRLRTDDFHTATELIEGVLADNKLSMIKETVVHVGFFLTKDNQMLMVACNKPDDYNNDRCRDSKHGSSQQKTNVCIAAVPLHVGMANTMYVIRADYTSLQERLDELHQLVA